MKRITIASYNIRHGHDVTLDWRLLAEIMHESRADIIGIQEVDMHTGRTHGADTVSGLMEATGMPYSLFIPAMDFDGGQYGTAILSRYPIQKSEIHPLDAEGHEPRAFGCVTVTLEDGDELCFVNTHLSYESIELQNRQFDQLAKWMDEHIDQNIPTILTGDFNTEDFTQFSPLTELGYALINHADQTYRTFRNPPIAIDNIVYRTACFTPEAQGMIDSNRSDHNLLWCRFEIK